MHIRHQSTLSGHTSDPAEVIDQLAGILARGLVRLSQRKFRQDRKIYTEA